MNQTGVVDDPEGHHVLFTFACLAQKAEKHALARSAWEKYIDIRPSDAKGHCNLGLCLHALGEPVSALKCFEQALGLQPSMSAVITVAAANASGLLMQTGQAERASSLCYLALEGGATGGPALFNLNASLRMVGRQSEAVALSWRYILRKIPLGTVAHTAAFNAAAVSAAACKSVEDHSAAVNPPLDSGMLVNSDAASASRLSLREPRPNRALQTRAHEIVVQGTHSGSRGKRNLERGLGCLTVACVRWGDKYGPEYVKRLALGVRRNLRRSRYRFVCFTDDIGALGGISGVEARPLGLRCADWKGWWLKGFLFSSEANLQGRVLYLDLDTVITGCLEDIAAYSGPFAALSVAGMANERRPVGLNSSVMSWDAGREKSVQAVYDLLQEAYMPVTECVHKFDHWLEMTLPAAVTLQQAVPGQIVEYKADCCQAVPRNADTAREVPNAQELRSRLGRISILEDDGSRDRGGDSDRGGALCATSSGAAGQRGEGALPRDARIVCFPLKPKPHEVESAWVQRLWRDA